MIKFHYLKFFKYIVVLLVIYNIIALLVLFLPNKKLKYNIWRLTPYDYSYLTGYPNFLENLSILNSTNREEIKEVRAGDIAACIGLKDITTGDTICDLKNQIVLERMDFPEPVISVAVAEAL